MNSKLRTTEEYEYFDLISFFLAFNNKQVFVAFLFSKIIRIISIIA